MQYKSEYENDNFYRYTHTLESRIIGGVEIIGGGVGYCNNYDWKMTEN